MKTASWPVTILFCTLAVPALALAAVVWAVRR